ncbi:hypothetical protein HDZ31DRAFT_63176 [Schizophyllum fasciatum]
MRLSFIVVTTAVGLALAAPAAVADIASVSEPAVNSKRGSVLGIGHLEGVAPVGAEKRSLLQEVEDIRAAACSAAIDNIRKKRGLGQDVEGISGVACQSLAKNVRKRGPGSDGEGVADAA